MNECQRCERTTRRVDGLCMNCRFKEVPRNDFVSTQIRTMLDTHPQGGCETCGIEDSACLTIRIRDWTVFGKSLDVDPQHLKLFRAVQMAQEGTFDKEFHVFCEECLNQASTRSTGRPRLYTPTDAKERARAARRAHHHNMAPKLAACYPEGCVECGAPPNHYRWVGPLDVDLSGHRRRMLLNRVVRMPDLRWCWEPLCEDHKPMTYLQKAAVGRATAPASWGWAENNS